MAAVWGGDFVEGRCTVLPQASLALSIQREALDPVRPRGLCKWLGLAPPAPSSAPRGPWDLPHVSPPGMAIKSP